MRRSTHYWLALGVLLGTFLALGSVVPPGSGLPPAAAAEPKKAKPEALVERVRKAIDRGVLYLRSKQRSDDGSWEIDPTSKAAIANATLEGGWTSLALLALMNSGVSPDDPAVKKGLEYLRKVKPSFTYVVSLQTMVFAMAGKAEDRERIQRNVDWLIAARVEIELGRDKIMMKGWSYTKGDGRGVPDNSNSQYALLALHDAMLANAKVDKKTLKVMRDFYLKTQAGDGSWSYRVDHPDSSRLMTMTTAGLCNLIITGMDVESDESEFDPQTGTAKKCGTYKENKPVAKALEWMASQLPGVDNDIARGWGSPFYALYGLERAGRLTGRRYIGEVDWYRAGCEWLCDIQDREGLWKGHGGKNQFDSFGPSYVVPTSFALLFLSKGRTPVLLTKMAYGPGDNWNHKHNDARHLVEFASRELFKKKPMAWQVFDARKKRPTTDAAVRELAGELLASPVLYVNGHEFRPSGGDKAILKEYLDNGGFLFAEACCGSDDFDGGFRAVMKEIFPDDPLELLPAEHPVYTASGKFVVSPKDYPLYGVQKGCKTIVVYSKRPLAGYWEANLFEKGHGLEAFKLGANVLAYATGLEPPKPRLTENEIIADDKGGKVPRGYLVAAQLKHEGDWRPAPKAMRNLMAEARKIGLDVMLKTEEVPPTSEKVKDYRFLYMHGRGKFDLGTAKDLEKLRFTLKTGGLLLADACCGSKAFDESFRKLMETMWAEEKLKLEKIPLDDDLFSAALNGKKITTVRCRRELPGGKRDTEYKDVEPMLEGVKYNGRWVVIYSKYDLGCALEKHKSTDCLGHDYESAVTLGKAAVMYALKR